MDHDARGHAGRRTVAPTGSARLRRLLDPRPGNLIDNTVILVPSGLLALIALLYPAAGLSSAPSTAEGQAVEVAKVLGALLTAVYFVICWSRGRTLGMRILSLGVVHAETGERIGVVRAIIRYAVYA